MLGAEILSVSREFELCAQADSNGCWGQWIQCINPSPAWSKAIWNLIPVDIDSYTTF